jgi:hypothetical protein
LDTYDFDPDARYDFKKDWSLWLDGDVIVVSQWFVNKPGLVIDTIENNAFETVAWVGGWTEGASFLLTNRIITGGGRINDSSILIQIREK